MIERLPRIMGGYLVACLASGFAIALGLLLTVIVALLLTGRWQDPGVAGSTLAFLFAAVWLGGSGVVAVLAFVPALVVIGVAEAARLRAATFYGCVGSIGAIGCWGIFVREGGWLRVPVLPPLPPGEPLITSALVLVITLAGLIGGLVYWAIAGKTAGAWRDASGGHRLST